MTTRIFAWVAGSLMVGVFMIATFIPDLLRGYVDESVALADVSSGERVYNVYCIGCHGENGDGNGEAADLLIIKPRNFVDGDFKYFYFGEEGPLPTDDSLSLTIRNGLTGSSMPAFPLLSEQEVTDVRSYIQSFRAGGWSSQVAGVGELPSAPPIEGETGEELFKAAGCNGCHQLDVANAIGGVGPNLNDIGARLSLDEINMSIVAPNDVIAEICPAGPCVANVMPQNFGERFTDSQLDALSIYLSEQK